MKKVLIITRGIVPLSEDTIVEGGGLRAWGLANGIALNNRDIVITVAYNEAYKTEQHAERLKGIGITTWRPDDEEFKQSIKQYDSIITLYSDVEMVSMVLESITLQQQLILDCYVPIYVEISARNSNDVVREFHDYIKMVPEINRGLLRADAILCANQKQKEWYYGVLSALGRVNPITFADEDNFIIVVPYGIYEDVPIPKSSPFTKFSEKSSDALKLLWFGGIYPWFDLAPLIDAVAEINDIVPCELAIVGAKSPFVDHPDFNDVYSKAVNYIKQKNAGNIHLVDWVPFNSRADWYLDSDAVFLLNRETIENKFSWRTRLVDYIWADLPVITNGGDPLSDMLNESDALTLIPEFTTEAIKEVITRIASNRAILEKQRQNISTFKKSLLWVEVTKPLVDVISVQYKALDSNYTREIEDSLYKQEKVVVKSEGLKHAVKSVLKSRLGLLYRIYSKLRRLEKNGGQSGKAEEAPQNFPLKIFTHQLDFTGAPLVLLDVLKQISNNNKLVDNCEVVSFNTFAKPNPEIVKMIHSFGLKKVSEINKMTDYAGFCKGDVVFVNTIAYHEWVYDDLLRNLENGTIKHVFLYAHEDEPSKIFGSFSQELEILTRFTEQVIDKNITIYVPSFKTRKHYNDMLGFEESNQTIRLMPGRLDIENGEFLAKEVDEFDDLTFSISGSASDIRKGHLDILYAFSTFYEFYYKKNVDRYRDFKLILTGFIEGSLIFERAKFIVQAFSDRCKLYQHVSHKEQLNLLTNSNMSILYSLNEALPIVTFEGMAFGHPIIRNDASGFEEQFNGKNGWAVENADWIGLVDTIEAALNKEKTSNLTLHKMSKESCEIARKAAQTEYQIIDDISAMLYDD